MNTEITASLVSLSLSVAFAVFALSAACLALVFVLYQLVLRRDDSVALKIATGMLDCYDRGLRGGEEVRAGSLDKASMEAIRRRQAQQWKPDKYQQPDPPAEPDSETLGVYGDAPFQPEMAGVGAE